MCIIPDIVAAGFVIFTAMLAGYCELKAVEQQGNESGAGYY